MRVHFHMRSIWPYEFISHLTILRILKLLCHPCVSLRPLSLLVRMCGILQNFTINLCLFTQVYTDKHNLIDSNGLRIKSLEEQGIVVTADKPPHEHN